MDLVLFNKGGEKEFCLTALVLFLLPKYIKKKINILGKEVILMIQTSSDK